MTEIIFCGTPKRPSTVQGRVRSTESSSLVRSIKLTYNKMSFFRANSCSRRITNNITSVVERFGRKQLCTFDRIRWSYIDTYIHTQGREKTARPEKVCQSGKTMITADQRDQEFCLPLRGLAVGLCAVCNIIGAKEKMRQQVRSPPFPLYL